MSEAPAPAAAPAPPSQPAQATPPATPPAPGGTPPQQPAATPPATPPAPAAASVPAKYELKLPDGSPLDPSELDKVATVARERGLSNEQAQALLDQRHEGAAELSQRQADLTASKRTEWESEVKADPELGGTNFDATLKHTKAAMDRIFPESEPWGAEVRKVLNESAWGNHPAFVRAMQRIGKAISEDKPLGGPGGSEGGPKTPAEILYGGDPK